MDFVIPSEPKILRLVSYLRIFKIVSLFVSLHILPLFAINIASSESRRIENLYKAPINNINRTASAFWQKVSIAWIKAEIAGEQRKI